MTQRLIPVAIALGFWVLGLGIRLEYLQVERHEHYRERAAAQQRRVLDLEPPRGTIYDARGRVLAVSAEVESVWADPSQIVDPRGTATALASLLPVDRDVLEARLSRDKDFVFVARKLDPPQAAAVADLDLPGIHFLRESKRYYPLRELAAPVLGFVGTDHKGLAGLEAHYDDVVGGQAGRRTVLRDARRRTLLSPRLAVVEAEPGADLRLTLDASVQHMVERELAKAVAAHRAKSGVAVLLEPRTGAVVAMAQVPTFDPNRFAESTPGHWRNRAIADAFEPGSTFKIVTAAAVLEHGLLQPTETLDCEMGSIVLAGQRIRDHHPFGLLSVRQVVAKSSNVGVIKMGLLVGEQRLHGEILDFGFGRRSGIDLPGESPGIVRDVASWSALSKAYISFGQEISVTPLQLARAVAAVAADGSLHRPFVVAGGDSRDGIAPGEPGEAVPPTVAAELRRMLRGVVAEGTGRRAALTSYSVAGKTGTAQKIVDGRYSSTRFVASFVGLAPVDEPRLAGVVVLDEPWPAYHGGEAAAPAFAAMVEQILLYWGVPPSPPADPRFEALGDPAPLFDGPVPEPPGPPTVVRASLPPVAGPVGDVGRGAP